MPVLNWIGKEAVVKHHKEVPFRLLEPVQELSLSVLLPSDALEAAAAEHRLIAFLRAAGHAHRWAMPDVDGASRDAGRQNRGNAAAAVLPDPIEDGGADTLPAS